MKKKLFTLLLIGLLSVPLLSLAVDVFDVTDILGNDNSSIDSQSGAQNNPIFFDVPTPVVSASSGGETGKVSIIVSWSLPSEYMLDDPNFVEDYGWRVTKNDEDYIEILTSDENGVTDGTISGYFEDADVIEGQIYTYQVQIFDRLDENSDPVSISVKAEADDLSDAEGCTVNPALTLTTDGKNVSLEWDEMCGAYGYNISKRKLPNGTATVIANTISDYKYIDANVEEGNYEYEVIGYELLSDTPINNTPPISRLLGIKQVFAAGATKEVARAKATITVTKTVAAAAASGVTGVTGTGGTSGSGSGTGIHLSSNFGDMFKKVYNFAIGLASIILCVLLLVGGIMYLTAAGNDESSKKARNLIVDAVVGFVILLIIYSAGKFVIKKLEIPVPSDSPIAMNLSDNINLH
jgi:hypothetical protein